MEVEEKDILESNIFSVYNLILSPKNLNTGLVTAL